MYFDQTKEGAIKNLNSSKHGLTSLDAKKRLLKCGPNELKQEHKIHPFKIFLEQFNSPLVWILILLLFVFLRILIFLVFFFFGIFIFFQVFLKSIFHTYF